MDSDSMIQNYDEMIGLLLKKKLQLANNIGKDQTNILLQEAIVIKTVIENAHTLKKLLFNQDN